VTLLQQMEAVSLLLRQGYVPQRTIYLAFGHDEEVGGTAGVREALPARPSRCTPSGLLLLLAAVQSRRALAARLPCLQYLTHKLPVRLPAVCLCPCVCRGGCYLGTAAVPGCAAGAGAG
jgi:hypothetical protein